MNCEHKELMKVEEEALGEEPSSLSFICYWCGEVVHKL